MKERGTQAGFESEDALALAEGVLNGGSIGHGRPTIYPPRVPATVIRQVGCFTSRNCGFCAVRGWPGSLRLRPCSFDPRRPARVPYRKTHKSGETCAADGCAPYALVPFPWVRVSSPSTSVPRAAVRCRASLRSGVLELAEVCRFPNEPVRVDGSLVLGLPRGSGSTCSGRSTRLASSAPGSTASASTPGAATTVCLARTATCSAIRTTTVTRAPTV